MGPGQSRKTEIDQEVLHDFVYKVVLQVLYLEIPL